MSTLPSKYLGIYSDLIKLAAQMAKGEGVADWSERVFSTGTPSYERRDMLSALRAADEAGITHALQLRAIADRLSVEIRSSNETECTACGGDGSDARPFQLACSAGHAGPFKDEHGYYEKRRLPPTQKAGEGVNTG